MRQCREGSVRTSNSAIHAVIIVGLKRSGTTILWETFRKNRELLCFDEPFHPRLSQGIRQNGKGTWTELAKVLNLLENDMPSGAIHISASDELGSYLSTAQHSYFEFLLKQGDKVVLDEVRVWNKLEALLSKRPEVFVIHLVRDPAAWVTAHLLPSRKKTCAGTLMDFYRKKSFFSRRRNFDNWRYEEIVNRALQTQ
jgi:hypothetical protein